MKEEAKIKDCEEWLWVPVHKKSKTFVASNLNTRTSVVWRKVCIS